MLLFKCVVDADNPDLSSCVNSATAKGIKKKAPLTKYNGVVILIYLRDLNCEIKR